MFIFVNMFLCILLQQSEITGGSQTLPHFFQINGQQTTAAETDRGDRFMIITSNNVIKEGSPPLKNVFCCVDVWVFTVQNDVGAEVDTGRLYLIHTRVF